MHRRFLHRFTATLASAAAVALLFQSLPCAGTQEVLDGVSAVVNSDVIVYSQIRELAGEKEKAVAKQLRGQELVNRIKEIRLAALNELIDRALVLQEFKKQGFEIPKEVVDQRIATIVRDKFDGDQAAFLRSITAQGYPLDRIRQLERDKAAITEMRRKAIEGKIAISEVEISDYYRQYDASGKPLKAVHDEIEKALIQNESRQLQQEWIKELRKGAYIKIYEPIDVLD